MKITVRKDIDGLRAAGIARVNAAAGAVRSLFITIAPGQEMIYLAKEAEALRYLATYPEADDEPEPLDSGPGGFPFIAAEIGLTAPSAWALAQLWAARSVQFRAIGAAIETVRLGGVGAIEAAGSPAEIAGVEASVAAGLAAIGEMAP